MEKLKPFLKLDKITKIYGSFKALDSVSFDLYPGEVHCIVGENGAGKSTLIKSLSGAVSPEEGQIYLFSDSPIKDLNPRKSIQKGISTIYQDAELVDSLTAADNVFLGDEEISRFPFVIDVASQKRRVREILDNMHLTIPVDALAEDLSTSESQMLQIIKAIYKKAKVIVMDEPTSSLGLEEKKSLMDLIFRLKNDGLGIIYISHYLEEIFKIADRITILRDGKKVGTYKLEEISEEEIIRKMVGRDASMFYSRRKVEIGEEKAVIKDYSKAGVVRDVSFSVKAGEVFGIGGLVGSGRSEFAHLLFGSDRPDRGNLFLNGKNLTIKSPKDAIKHGVCFVTEDRKKLGMLRGRNIIENITSVHNENFRGPIIDHKEETKLANEIIDKLSIVVSSKDQLVEELSGGNQQKVVIGKWLIDSADLYIFDEPTKGVDIGAKEKIYELLVDLAEAGKAIIIISSDMPELLSMSDRIGIMRNGEMVEIIPNEDVQEEQLIKKFLGVEEKEVKNEC